MPPLPADWFLPLTEAERGPSAAPAPPRRRGTGSWARFRRSRLGLPGLAALVLVVAAVVLGPHLSATSYNRIHLAEANLPPGPGHWFGTDQLGRDTFARTWVAGRISLTVGTAAAAVDLGLGTLYGGIAGLVGGAWDAALMRLVDILYAIPLLLVAILLLLVLGPGPLPTVVAIACVGWLGMARLVRGQVLLLKEQGYVRAARGLGVSPLRLLVRHLLPNAAGPILAWVTYTVAGAVFAEALLSYVGLGVEPPLTSWGAMLASGAAVLPIHPAQFLFPAGALSLTLLGLYAVGDGLQTAGDPRLGGGS